MTSIRIYAPVGEVGSAAPSLAPNPTILAGKRIVALDNGKPGADRLLTQIAEQLAKRTGASYVRTARKGSAATPCEDALFEEIVAEADLVVTGTAD